MHRQIHIWVLNRAEETILKEPDMLFFTFLKESSLGKDFVLATRMISTEKLKNAK